ncbi:MAG TPA: 16S rRNA (adenine(1518)-N(6)/adenine(1519)-N(6))-dimethyltransferase RsmA [Candidatus Paceibacterota bacterium]|nr:16S rRNA (adenine(1518)-N(6)/adenine(1519)-N(6))-dimethyltransferase RsmA [Candidatus Paceibacterota bacterium]
MIFAKKSLGQNFLISPRVVGAIAMAGDIAAGEKVIEIGPGKGILTKALLDAGAHVKAIEKDDRLIPILAETFKKEIAEGRLDLIHGDVMEMDIETIAAGSYKVIANIPYYVTGGIIRDFLSATNKPSLMVLMVQKEVATRIIARDGKESILSISVKTYADAEIAMSVSRGNFFPIPNVDSAVIRLFNIRDPFADRASEVRFFEIVKSGFAQKRKKLSKNLGTVMSKEDVTKKFAELGLDENARAEDVALETWIELAR